MRVLQLTAAVPLPVYLVASLALPAITPQTVTMSQNRVVFLHEPGTRATVRIMQSGSRRTWGQTRRATPTPPDSMRIVLESKNSPNELRVIVATGVCSYADADGVTRVRPTQFDESVIEGWLAVHGFSGDAVADAADDLKAAIDDMKNPAPAARFLRFTNPDGHERGVAHPTSPAMVTRTSPPLARLIPLAIAALAWLIGLPFVWRRANPRGAAPRSPALLPAAPSA
jgi:hypothetical protein